MLHRAHRVHCALRAFWVACAFALVAAASPARAADAPPIEHFFRHPELGDAKLSPSGKRLGVLLVGAGGRVVLGVVDLDKRDQSRTVAAFDGADVRTFRWVNDQRLVFNAIDFAAASGEQYGAGLFAVNADGSGFRMLVKRRRSDFVTAEGNTRVESRQLEWNHRLHDTLRDGSDDIVVERAHFNDRGVLLGTSLLRMNTVTGAATTLSFGAPAGARAWWVDARGEPRACYTVDGAVGRLHWRDAAGAWSVLREGPRNEPPVEPVAIDASGTLYVAALRDDPARTRALYRFDPARREPEAEPLVALAGFDFDGELLFDAEQRRLLGARYRSDAAGTAWFDPAWQRWQERVDKLLPATVNRLSCERCGEAPRVLVRAASDRQSAVYWLYDTRVDRLERVAAERPWIDPKAMAERSFVRIQARDGLEIPTYLTQPRGKGPWPTVVLVHGGPWVRGGDWEWDAEAQFLASRGYLVIEPEFRGSLGFGARHFRAGFRQWGLAMQDDVADATLWAVQRGLADRSRTCIAGASYGGYAALMGLVRHPELYRCAVNWVGVTDIDLMYTIAWSDLSDDWKRHGMPVLVGDREKDAAQLAATSPLKQAERITQPLLMAYGSNDRRVPVDHGMRFRDAVSAHNKQVEWVVYPEEGHGFLLVKNKVDFWSRVEKFLARQIGAPAPSPATASGKAP